MATTLQIPSSAVTRFVKTSKQGPSSNSLWQICMSRAITDLESKEWTEAASLTSSLTVNDPKQKIEDPTLYDAFRQSSDATEGSGLQTLYAGMSCYRVKIKGDATVSKVRIKAFDDTFCYGGLSVVAWLSNDETPPAAFTPRSSQPNSSIKEEVLSTTQELGTGKVLEFDFTDNTFKAKYVYLAVSLFNYNLWNQKYWWEGSGGLDYSTIELEFSEDGLDIDVITGEGVLTQGTPFNLGVVEFSNDFTASDALVKIPRLAAWQRWVISMDATAYSNFKDKSLNSYAENLTSLLKEDPSLFSATGSSSIVGQNSLSTAVQTSGAVSLTDYPQIGFSALMVHGHSRNKVFKGLKFENAMDFSTIPTKVVVYGVSKKSSFGSNPPVATGALWWGNIFDEKFRSGKASSVKVLKDPKNMALSISEQGQSSSDTTDVPATALFVKTVNEELPEIIFDREWQSGEISTLYIALVPDGIPTGGVTSKKYDATVNQTVSIKLLNTEALKSSKASRNVVVTPSSAYVSTRLSSALPDGSCKFDGYHGLPYGSDSISSNSSEYFFMIARVIGDSVTFVRITNTSKTATFNETPYLCIDASFILNGETYSFNDQIPGDASDTCKVTVYMKNIKNYSTGSRYGYIGDGIADLTVKATAFSKTVTFTSTSGNKVNVLMEVPATNMDVGATSPSVVDGVTYTSPIHAAVLDEVLFTPHQYYKTDPLAWMPSSHAVSGVKYTVLIDGYSYTWSDATSGDVERPIILSSRTASFEKDGVVYTSSLDDKTITCSTHVDNKTTSTVGTTGNDVTTTAGVSATIPEISQTVDFVSESGDRIKAVLTLPETQITSSNTVITAKDAYTGSTAKVQDLSTSGTENAVDTAHYAEISDIDVGTVTLYE